MGCRGSPAHLTTAPLMFLLIPTTCSEGTGILHSSTDGGISGEYPNPGTRRLFPMRRWFTFSGEAIPQISKEFEG